MIDSNVWGIKIENESTKDQRLLPFIYTLPIESRAYRYMKTALVFYSYHLYPFGTFGRLSMEYGGIYEKKMLIIGGQYSYIIDIYSVFCLLLFTFELYFIFSYTYYICIFISVSYNYISFVYNLL